MVRPSLGTQLLIRRCCAPRAYCVMLHNCFSRCSRPIWMQKLSYTHRCKLACHSHVSTFFYWCYIIRSNNTSWCPFDQSEWINCLRCLLWMPHQDKPCNVFSDTKQQLYPTITMRRWQESYWLEYKNVYIIYSKGHRPWLLNKLTFWVANNNYKIIKNNNTQIINVMNIVVMYDEQTCIKCQGRGIDDNSQIHHLQINLKHSN